MRPGLVVRAASRGVSRRFVLALAATWIAFCVLRLASLPLLYPYQVTDGILDSGLVVGLVLPVAVGSRVLVEADFPPTRTAVRPLAGDRLFWAAVALLVSVVGSSLVAWTNAGASLSVLAAGLLLASLGLLGVGLLGAHGQWAVPLAVAFVASVPDLVPARWNVLYLTSASGQVLLLSGVVLAVSLPIYARSGSTGVVPRPGRDDL